MCGPGLLIGEAPVGMFDQASDQMGGERAFAHVGQCLGIDDVIIVAARSSARKLRRLFEAVVPNQVKCELPICVQKPFAALWRAQCHPP